MVGRIYRDRYEAGRLLADLLKDMGITDGIIVAVPKGGVAVAYPIAEELGLPLRTVGVKKLAPPYSPESGFGAVAVDGSVVVDEGYMNLLGVDYGELEEIRRVALSEALEKHRKFRGVKPEEVEGRSVIVVDDGIATGYTVIAAAEFLRNAGADEMVLAVPVASESAYRNVQRYYDGVICPEVVSSPYFAVGAFYEDFHQLSDEEVLSILAKVP